MPSINRSDAWERKALYYMSRSIDQTSAITRLISDGALNVRNVNATGAGDASSANQLTQIARADTLIAGQSTTNARLTSINNKTPTLGAKTAAGSVPVVLATDHASHTVEGTGTAGTPNGGVLTVQGATGMEALKIDGSGSIQPISAASLPLPAGAATSANQPGLGTAGAPNADVLTVQGATGMTALDVALTSCLPSGTNTIGNVGIVGSLPAGSNNIGAVDVVITNLGPGTEPLSLGKAAGDDYAAGHVGVGMWAVDSNGDYAPFRLTASNHLQVDVLAELPSGSQTIGSIAAVTSNIDPGTDAGSLGKATGEEYVAGHVGVGAWAVTDSNAYAPLRVDSGGSLITSAVSVPATTGTHANMWDNVAPGQGGTSTALDAQYTSTVDLFGVVSNACSMTTQLSQDNSNWYNSIYSYVATADNEDWHIAMTTGARYVRLRMDTDGGTVVTATGAGKS